MLTIYLFLFLGIYNFLHHLRFLFLIESSAPTPHNLCLSLYLMSSVLSLTTVVLHHIFRFVVFGIPHHHHLHAIKIQRHTLEPTGVDALSFLPSLATHIRCLVDPNIQFSFLLSLSVVDSVHPYALTFQFTYASANASDLM